MRLLTLVPTGADHTRDRVNDVQLTHGGGFNPVAGPDGRTVYYLRGEKESWLWSVSTDGGEETRDIEVTRAREMDRSNEFRGGRERHLLP